ncbi:hypothetical protein ACQZV8_17465 [Magnetococcales bacterium HHB-1]
MKTLKLSSDHDVTIMKQDEQFIVCTPSLGIIVSNEKLDLALAEMQSKQEKITHKIHKYDIGHLFSLKKKRTARAEMRSFIYKIMLSVALIGFISLAMVSTLRAVVPKPSPEMVLKITNTIKSPQVTRWATTFLSLTADRIEEMDKEERALLAKEVRRINALWEQHFEKETKNSAPVDPINSENTTPPTPPSSDQPVDTNTSSTAP